MNNVFIFQSRKINNEPLKKKSKSKLTYVNNVETEPPLRHFTDQTTEATILKYGSGVLFSIRLTMEIIESVLINAFVLFLIQKKLFYSISFVFLRFVSFYSIPNNIF